MFRQSVSQSVSRSPSPLSRRGAEEEEVLTERQITLIVASSLTIDSIGIEVRTNYPRGGRRWRDEKKL